jgi:protein-S-isoprenylcysteine O-methyltransferase Ste14
MKPKSVIVLFFLGLLFMVILELALIWLFHQVLRLPSIDLSWLNNLLGGMAVIVGGALVIWSVSVQYKFGQGTPAPVVPTQKLVVKGPYAYTRNPMTLGAALFYLGVGVWLGSLPVIGMVLLIFASLLVYIFHHETKELAQRFGADYLAYKQNTPFLFPRFRKKKGP